MRYYPFSIDTMNKKILIVGGGKAACIKIKSTLKSMAEIIVVSREFCNEIIEMQKLKCFVNRLVLNKREITVENLQLCLDDNYIAAFICTNDDMLNEAVHKFLILKKIPVLMVGRSKDNSDFITSSIVEKDEIVISMNTQGHSPTVTKLIKEKINDIFTEDFSEKINLLCEIRKELIERNEILGTHYINIKDEMDKLNNLNNDELRERIKEMKVLT